MRPSPRSTFSTHTAPQRVYSWRAVQGGCPAFRTGLMTRPCPAVLQLCCILILVAPSTLGVRAGSVSRSLRASAVELPTGADYDIGLSLDSLTQLWVDPVAGNDDNSGASRDQALRTFTAAWGRVPEGTTLTTGVRIRVAAGTFAEGQAPLYWESRKGTYAAPIVVEAVDGRNSVTFPNVNIFDCSYLYFIDVRIAAGGGDVLHCEKCVGLLLRRVTVVGADPASYAVQEAVKINQSKGVYIEDCDISGAWDNAVDFVAVQYGHVLRSKIHNAGWCIYFKGGSAYFVAAGNRIYKCDSSGIAAGQGTGFEYMEPNWIQYEAYDIKIVNNMIYNVNGAGLGVFGGYNIFMAYNTLWKVGQRSHVIEVKLGDRSCDGDAEKVENCRTYLAAGGWGPPTPSADGVKIPNMNVRIVNNVVWNPPGYESQWQHFQVDGHDSSNCPNLPSTVKSDNALVIRGNVIWNGGPDKPLGLGESTGCKDSNPTCNAAQLVAQNAINSPGLEPKLANPRRGKFRLKRDSPLRGFDKLWTNIPDFGAWSPGLPVPEGAQSLAVAADARGQSRTDANNAPGAYAL